jgi:hypothetical protein
MSDYPDDNIPTKLSKLAEKQPAAAIRAPQRRLDATSRSAQAVNARPMR